MKINLNALALIGISLSTLLLNGCASMGPNESTGTLIGGVSGAAIGGAVSRNAVGAGVGAVAGGLVGNAIGRSADANVYNDY
jgi:hypothetical protein